MAKKRKPEPEMKVTEYPLSDEPYIKAMAGVRQVRAVALCGWTGRDTDCSTVAQGKQRPHDSISTDPLVKGWSKNKSKRNRAMGSMSADQARAIRGM